jgi:hypothetical protein
MLDVKWASDAAPHALAAPSASALAQGWLRRRRKG